jgi:hypothetical protein
MRYLIMLASIVLVSTAFAADIPINEFRRKGGGLVCTTETFKPDEGYLQCLRIGPIYIGQRERDVERLLGNPWKVIKQDDSTTIKVFPIESNEESKPYWVITFKNGAAEAVQVTGKNPKVTISFSSIKLGDKKSRVLEILGKPFASETIEDIKGTLWSYRPFPISIEIVDDRVYSMRLSRTSQ